MQARQRGPLEPSSTEVTLAFLVCHGSFNPVHKDHFAMMISARRALESAGYRVINSILAPTDRTHIERKGIEVMDDAHRFEALRLACQEHNEDADGQFTFDIRGVRYGSGYAMIRRLLQPEYLRTRPEAWGFDVKGADVVAKYQTYEQEVRYPCVIVGRAGFTENVVTRIERARRGMSEESWCFVVAAELEGEVSSTRLREALLQRDETAVRGMCSDRVAQYLMQLGEDLFKEKHEWGFKRGMVCCNRPHCNEKIDRPGAPSVGDGCTITALSSAGPRTGASCTASAVSKLAASPSVSAIMHIVP